MIEIQNVSVEKEGHLLLDQLSLTMDQKRIGIIGHNGSGKSTFVRLLNGIELPTSGQVIVDDLNSQKDRKAVLRKVGFVFQNPDNQIVYPLVREDLAFGLKNRRLPKEEITNRIEKLATQFNVTALLDRLSHNLSGGEKQIIALLGVLVMEPDYLVLDEPTTLLDLRNKKILMDILDQLPQTVIVVSHDLEFLETYDHVICFEKGRILHQGKPDETIRVYRESVL